MYGLIIASFVARSEMRKPPRAEDFPSSLDRDHRGAQRVILSGVAGLAGVAAFLQVLDALR